jgi:hypothetical protein
MRANVMDNALNILRERGGVGADHATYEKFFRDPETKLLNNLHVPA